MSKNLLIGLVLLAGAAAVLYFGRASSDGSVIPLKEAKLNIEHNATDNDTGFQGFLDSEGWANMTVTGPGGKVLSFKGKGVLGSLGLTELFFETVEPENGDVPIEEMLAMLPEGLYTFSGDAVEVGEKMGRTQGTALLTHAIPAGPQLVAPASNALVSAGLDLVFDWEPVTATITGQPVNIVAYQIIVAETTSPQEHMIGKPGRLDIYLPPSQTSIRVPREFLERESEYEWEVLAIEESGNQTLSSAEFTTR
jgi:hypothetical protein